MAQIRSQRVSGLILSPGLTSNNVTSLDMTFEPSIGIMAKKIDKLGLDIRSFKEPLTRAVREVMIPSFAMNFHKHGRPRWPELSEETIRQKGHARPLYLTGALQRTMGFMNIWHIDREKALIANLPQNVWYGVVHQAGVGDPNSQADMWYDPVRQEMVNIGEGAGQINIPARPFVMIQPEDERKIDDVFYKWLDERILQAGLGVASVRGTSL